MTLSESCRLCLGFSWHLEAARRRVVREDASGQNTSRPPRVASLRSRATCLRKHVEVPPRSRSDDVQELFCTVVAVGIVEVRNHPVEQGVSDDDIELGSFDAVNGGYQDPGARLERVVEEGDVDG